MTDLRRGAGKRSDDPSPPYPDSFQQILTSPHYERLRARLIRVFAQRGCSTPEELADETIARVASKLDEVASTYEGNPAAYFLGVARNVYREHRRQPAWVELDVELERAPAAAGTPPSEDASEACLEICLAQLDSDERFLIIQYYRYEKGANIEHRQLLAETFGIGLNTLRIRAYRIRGRLAQCVGECVEKR